MGNIRSYWVLLGSLSLLCASPSALATPTENKAAVLELRTTNTTIEKTVTNLPNTTIAQKATNATSETMSQISAAPQNGTIDNSGNAGYGPSNYTICNYSAKFDSLFGLNVAIAESGLANATGPFVGGGIGSIFSNLTVRSDCIAVYTLQALLATMDTAYNNYTVVNDGYDKEFGYYITYMEKIVPEVIDGVVMFDAANASAAESMAPVGPGMQCMNPLLN